VTHRTLGRRQRSGGGLRAWLRPALALLLATAGVLAATVPLTSGLRVGMLVLFLVFGPGLALVGLLMIRDPWREAAFAIGVSLAVDVVVVGTLGYAGVERVGTGLGLLVGITGIGAVAQGLRRRARGTGAVS
jgi:hypothetical protein